MDWKSDPAQQAAREQWDPREKARQQILQGQLKAANEYHERIVELAALTGSGYAYLRAKINEYASRSTLTANEVAGVCIERARNLQSMPWEVDNASSTRE